MVIWCCGCRYMFIAFVECCLVPVFAALVPSMRLFKQINVNSFIDTHVRFWLVKRADAYWMEGGGVGKQEGPFITSITDFSAAGSGYYLLGFFPLHISLTITVDSNSHALFPFLTRDFPFNKSTCFAKPNLNLFLTKNENKMCLCTSLSFYNVTTNPTAHKTRTDSQTRYKVWMCVYNTQ